MNATHDQFRQAELLMAPKIQMRNHNHGSRTGFVTVHPAADKVLVMQFWPRILKGFLARVFGRGWHLGVKAASLNLSPVGFKDRLGLCKMRLSDFLLPIYA